MHASYVVGMNTSCPDSFTAECPRTMGPGESSYHCTSDAIVSCSVVKVRG